MLAREMFIKEFDYNYWANGRILDQAQLVSEEEWTAKSNAEGRSLHEILAHLFAVERVWRLLSAHGLIQDGEIPGPDQLTNVDAQRELSDVEAQYMGILLQDWSDQAFADEVMVTRRDGTTFPMVRWFSRVISKPCWDTRCHPTSPLKKAATRSIPPSMI